jgi:hypothetical protein
MIQRCYDPKHVGFKWYGGRGITVCDRWRFGEDGLSGYECFFQDIGPKPTPQHSLDRINNDGNYTPGNVRWADAKTQAANRQTSANRRSSGNRKSSLRTAKRSNARKRISSSGVVGVYKHGRNGWKALISVHGKLVYIGTFDSPEVAAEMYAIAAEQRDAARFARAKEVAMRRIAEGVQRSRAMPEGKSHG